MSEKPYSNREIDFFLKEILDSLARIEKQTTKTNGRVTRLEQWRSLLTGMSIILNIIVIPILFKIFL